MRVLLDFRPALGEVTGVGRYLRSIVRALAARGEPDRYILFSGSLKDRIRERVPDLPPGLALVDRKVPVRLLNFLWHNLQWPPVEVFAGSVDITHSPTPLPVPSRSAKTIVTVHDLHFLLHPEDTQAEIRRDYTRLASRSIVEADALIVPSLATAGELVSVLGVPRDRIHVIHHGVDEVFTRRSDDPHCERQEVLRLLGAPSGFFLFVGRPEPRKNLGAVLEAFKAMIELGFKDLKLVLAGPQGWGRPSLSEMIGRLQLDKHVIVTGWLGQAELARLYRSAAALVFMSKREGFGLPILEAMASGCPIITAPVSSMPEVGGEAALYCRADRPAEIAASMRAVLEEPAATCARVEKGKAQAGLFSWERSAEKTVELYESLL